MEYLHVFKEVFFVLSDISWISFVNCLVQIGVFSRVRFKMNSSIWDEI